MADSKVTIKIDADAEGAKRAFAEVQSSADAAMESGARSAQKLSKSLDGVTESAKITNQQIKALATGLAGAAVGIASVAMKSQGMDKEASYLDAAGSKALSWGATGAMAGGIWGLLGGTVLGAGVGLVQNHFEREAVGKEQQQGVRDAAKGLAEARAEMDRVSARTDDFRKVLESIGNTSADAASREKLRADEIKARQDEIAQADARMKGAERAMTSFAATIDGPMTKDQQEYFAQLEKDWKEAAKRKQEASGELKNLENQKVEKARPNFDTAGTTGERFASLLSGLEKAGIGYAANGTNAIIEKGNNIAAQSLAVLESIDQKTSEAPTAVFA